MWSSWAESAKSSVTQALDKTGDIISKAATNAGKSAREKNHQSSNSSSGSGGSSSNNATSIDNMNQPTIVQIPPDPNKKISSGVPPPSSCSMDLAVPTPVNSSTTVADISNDTTSSNNNNNNNNNNSNPNNNNENQLLNSISQGWFNVVDATKATLKQAEDVMKEQRTAFEQNLLQTMRNSHIHNYPLKPRDVSLPLDVEALQDAEVVYITDRIITMGHPTLDSSVNIEITGRRKVVAIAHLFERRHLGHYMIWNLSEMDYNIDLFHDQVLTYSFPGSPSPPLGLLLKLFISIESWLKADPHNVAIVHCLTGKGRTSTVLAAFLCWMGEAQFHDIYQALEYIATCKQITLDDLTIPSQRRYASYFKNMLDGIRPSQPPLMLKRIIMSEAPNFAIGPSRQKSTTNNDETKNLQAPSPNGDDSKLYGCLPYIQVFKAGTLLHTAAASLHFQQAENEVPFCYTGDGNISFHVNLVIQGDILIRARHLTPKMKRISMFRAAFHTGYAPPNVMRFTKEQLDGACSDDRLSSDFFIDFIFEPIDAEEASKLLSNTNNNDAGTDTTNNNADMTVESTKANIRQAVQASAEDSMLYGDSRFWDVITNRMKENNANQTTTIESNNNDDPFFGPTVGRRRDHKNSNDPNKFMDPNSTSSSKTTTTTQEQQQTNSLLGAFSIGGDMDFLPSVVVGSESTQMQNIDSPIPKSKKSLVGSSSAQQPPKKDSLLEALMGALDDKNHDENDQNDMEVVEFDDIEVVDDTTLKTTNAAFPVPTETPAETPTNLPPTSTTVSINSDNTTTTSNPPSITSSVNNDIQALMADATMTLDSAATTGLESDMDALLAGTTTSTTTEGLSDADLLNLDFDDAELDDLESFLSK